MVDARVSLLNKNGQVRDGVYMCDETREAVLERAAREFPDETVFIIEIDGKSTTHLRQRFHVEVSALRIRRGSIEVDAFSKEMAATFALERTGDIDFDRDYGSEDGSEEVMEVREVAQAQTRRDR